VIRVVQDEPKGAAAPKMPKTSSKKKVKKEGGEKIVPAKSSAAQPVQKSRSRPALPKTRSRDVAVKGQSQDPIEKTRTVAPVAAQAARKVPLTRTAADSMVAAWRAALQPASSPDTSADLKAHADAHASIAREEAGALAQASTLLGELAAKCPGAGDALQNDDTTPFNLLATASRAHAPLTRFVEVLVAATRTSAQKATFKSELKDMPSIIRKACTAYVDDKKEPQWRRVVDVARASIRVSNFEDMGKVVEALKKDREGMQVLRVRDKLGSSGDDGLKANAGYRFASVAVRISGHVCEILLEHKGLRKARSQEQHARYLRFRESLGSRI